MRNPHPKGVSLFGGWIEGVLDLQACRSDVPLILANCHFTDEPVFQDARLLSVNLQGSEVPALNMHRLWTEGDVFLRQDFRAHGSVDLNHGRVGGNLDNLKGQFDTGLSLNGTHIDGALFWEDIADPVPDLDLRGARIGIIQDDAQSWEQVETLHLSGLTYNGLRSNMGIAERLDWLERSQERDLPDTIVNQLSRQALVRTGSTGFNPQPYTQLARILDAEGHRAGAARVLEVREQRIRAAQQLRDAARTADLHGAAWLYSALVFRLRALANGAFGALFGYGHAPARVLWWVLGIWGFAVLLYGAAHDAGQMAPNSDVILTSAAWGRALAQGCATVQAAGCEMPVHLWLQMPEARDYETFSRGIYALDLFIPLDALGQETTWAPSRTRGTLGWIGHYARLPIQIAGWVITAVGAAVLTGLVGRKE